MEVLTDIRLSNGHQTAGPLLGTCSSSDEDQRRKRDRGAGRNPQGLLSTLRLPLIASVDATTQSPLPALAESKPMPESCSPVRCKNKVMRSWPM
jgi:hypothetical protein